MRPDTTYWSHPGNYRHVENLDSGFDQDCSLYSRDVSTPFAQSFIIPEITQPIPYRGRRYKMELCTMSHHG